MLPYILSIASISQFISATFFGFAFLAVGLACLVWGLVDWLKYRKVNDISTSKVRSMAAGLVELFGKVKPSKVLTAPLSKKPCVYFLLEEQQLSRNDLQKQSWQTMWVDKKFVNFYLDDKTGAVEVDPTEADVNVLSEESSRTIRFGSRNVSIQKMAGTLGLTDKLRVVETIIQPGDSVYVLGSAVIRPGVRSATNLESFIIRKGANDPVYHIAASSEKSPADQKTLLANFEKMVGKSLLFNLKTKVMAGAFISLLAVLFLLGGAASL